MRSLTDVLETGAAWITEEELEGMGKRIAELEAALREIIEADHLPQEPRPYYAYGACAKIAMSVLGISVKS